MKKNLIKFPLENILFLIGILISSYGLLNTWILRSNLPEGVCPIDDNRGIYVVGIVFLLSSIIVDYYQQKRRKVENSTDNI